MHLADFIRESRDDVQRFEAWWLEQSRVQPAHFPLELNPGDWFDQFLHFLSTDDQEQHHDDLAPEPVSDVDA